MRRLPLRIMDTAVAEFDPTLSPEELKAARYKNLTAQLPIVDPKSYRVNGEVAQGGIGRILRARDERLDRPVALKELLTSAGSVAEDRFVREALLTARLQHPSIVPLYEAGRWPTGEPFYAMKYVAGRSLADVLLECRSLEQRLGLLPHVLAVAEAMAYAHSERIIHRDLKPANILIGSYGETVVIDWGLAKDLSEEQRGARASSEEIGPSSDVLGGMGAEPPSLTSALTMHGAVMGTPAYMPLEQATGKHVDERADVYALGAILYHLLAGGCPYDGDSSIGILRKVVAAPPPPIESRQKGIPEDLLAIVKKAMARDPDLRYPSAKELADDLRRFQTGQIVGAHKYSTMELFRRFARRYRAALAVAAAALLLMGVAGAIGVRRNIEERMRAVAGENRALVAHKRAVEHADDLTLVQARAAVERDPNEALTWLKSLSDAFDRWPEARLIAADAASRGIGTVLRGHNALVNSISFSPDGKLLASTSDDHTARLWDLQTGQGRVLAGHADEVWGGCFSPSGKLFATSSQDKTLRIWDVQTGAIKRILTGSELPIPIVLFIDEDTVISRGDDDALRVWDLRTGAGRTLAYPSGLWGTPISPDRRLLALGGSASDPFKIYDIKTGAVESLSGHSGPIVGAAFSPDGKTVATRGKDGTAWRWDLSTRKGRIVAECSPHTCTPMRRTTTMAFSPDNKVVAVSGESSLVHVIDTMTGKTRTFEGHQARTAGVRFSPDGKLLASGSDDHTVRVWDLARGDSRVLRGFNDSVRHTTFSPDGQLLAAAGADVNIRIFPVMKTPSRVLFDHESKLYNVAFSPDGARVLASGKDGKLRLFELASGRRTALVGHTRMIYTHAFSPNGEIIASYGADGLVRVWDLSGHEIWAFEALYHGNAPHPYGIERPIRFSPDGRLLAAPDKDDGVILLDIDSGKQQRFNEGVFEQATTALAFSPDSKLLAAGSVDGTIRVWDLATQKSRILGRHDRGVYSLAFSPDGKILASGGEDHALNFWNMETGEIRRIAASGGGILQIAFSQDSRLAITLGIAESGVRLWDVATGAPKAFLRGHAGMVKKVSLSPNDEHDIATVGEDGAVRLWDIASGQSRVLQGHTGTVNDVAFSPDGKLIASVGDDETLRLWSDDLPADARSLRAWIEAATPDKIEMYHHCTQNDGG